MLCATRSITVGYFVRERKKNLPSALMTRDYFPWHFVLLAESLDKCALGCGGHGNGTETNSVPIISDRVGV